MEIWKNIIGFDGYQISNFGNVKSLDRFITYYSKNNKKSKMFQKGKILKLIKDKKGYLKVNLKTNQKTNLKFVHRLVAIHFLNKIKDKDIVNHIDCDKANNHFQNLEWVTSKENNIHAVINKRIKTKLTIEQVWDIKFNKKFDSMLIKDIASLFNVHSNTISSIRNGKKWKHITFEKNPNDPYKEEIVYLSKKKKFTDQEILDIRYSEKFKNISNRKLALIFNVSRSTIDNIRNFKIYKNVM